MFYNTSKLQSRKIIFGKGPFKCFNKLYSIIFKLLKTVIYKGTHVELSSKQNVLRNPEHILSSK